ncbi:MAG: hypothetical protein P8009_09140 [Gammaproteobacteria bacterium]
MVRVLLGLLALAAAVTAAAGGIPAGAPAKPRVYLIALGDNGHRGAPVGCGDSLIADGRAAPTGIEGLRASIERLLALPREPFGERGPYNALGGSHLVLDGLRLEQRRVVVTLHGWLSLGGLCDGPRVQAQLEATATQLPDTGRAELRLNGKPLAAALSLQ